MFASQLAQTSPLWTLSSTGLAIESSNSLKGKSEMEGPVKDMLDNNSPMMVQMRKEASAALAGLSDLQMLAWASTALVMLRVKSMDICTTYPRENSETPEGTWILETTAGLEKLAGGFREMAMAHCHCPACTQSRQMAAALRRKAHG
jgi:hypothetical protein